jgi:hypothetical protein
VDLAAEHARMRAAWQASVSLDPPSKLAELSAAGTARILTATSSGWVGGPSCALETPFSLFDRSSDGRWLVVSTRSRGEANARVLSPDGEVLYRLNLGDGIQHVAIDAADRIWVGWFDEGMFGSRDWRVPGQEWPPSSNGLACFDPNGAVIALPQWPADAGPIADCYALNVTGLEAWACPYTAFPVVCFGTGGIIRWWRNAFAGPKAIAVDGPRALIAGGYGEDANRVALVDLAGEGSGDEAVMVARWTLPLRRLPPSPKDWDPIWSSPTLLAGRGDVLHMVDDAVWTSWRVSDVVQRPR